MTDHEYRDSNNELLRRIKNGDSEARETLIKQNIGLVRSVANRFIGRGHEPDDLFQIGCIGLIKAADRFDLSVGVAFSTYAVPMIIGEIKRFIRDDGIIKVSRAYKNIAYKAATVKERMMAENKCEPLLTEIAAELNISPQELSTALEASRRPDSLFASMDDGKSESRPLAEKVSTDEDYEQKIDNRIMLRQALNKMDERERLIIYMRYFRHKTQTEIADMLGISQVQVSRLEKKLLRRMREDMKAI